MTNRVYPRFVGALVVCEGGGSAGVRLAVTQAVSALTALPSDKITVLQGETMKIIILGRKNMKKAVETEHGGGSGLTARVRAIFLNGRYAQQVEETDKILGQATLVDGTEGDAEEVSGEALPGDYFATARLTRQQARDSALSLLQEASGATEVDEAAAAEAARRASRRSQPTRSPKRRSKT